MNEHRGEIKDNGISPKRSIDRMIEKIVHGTEYQPVHIGPFDDVIDINKKNMEKNNG